MENLLYASELHFFQKNNSLLCYRIKEGSIYVIDDSVRDLLELCHGSRLEDIKSDFLKIYSMDLEEVDELINELIMSGLIMTNSEKESNYYLESKKSSLATQNSDIDSIVLQISYDCNLRCKYCYGDGGSYGVKRTYMSEEIARKAIDFLIEKSGKNKVLSITFFGGEPLLNFSLIKKVVQYARCKQEFCNKIFKFGVNTNGILLNNDEITNYLVENNIGVTVSIDGTKEYHDKYRVFEDGTGSYDYVIQGTKKFNSYSQDKVCVRMTITPDNIEFIDIAKKIKQMGFGKIRPYFVSKTDYSDFGLSQRDIDVVKQEYEKAAQEYISCLHRKEYYTTLSLFTSTLKQIHERKFHLFQCCAGRNKVSVTPEGKIYICHRLVENKECEIGDIFGNINTELRKKILNANVDNRNMCLKCWCRYLCGGGCYYNSLVNGGDLLDCKEGSCEINQYYYELCMYIYYTFQRLDSEFWTVFFQEANDNDRMVDLKTDSGRVI